MRFNSIWLLFLGLLAHLSPLIAAREVNFDDLFVNDPVLPEHIPKIAHFVFSKVRPLIWLEYASIKSAYVNLQTEKIHLWVPAGSKFEGVVWKHVMKIPGVTIRETVMPTKIYGNQVSVLAHVSDIVRLEAMYTEGGIYMDYNLIALRSSDPVIYNSSTNSTVMGREIAGLCNAMIMSKPHSSFLREWMAAYVNFKDEDWMSLSVNKPWDIYTEGNKDLTVLPIENWFYPSFLDANKVFLGHSWYEIDTNYGVHMWSTYNQFYSWLTPESVREIDTPLFCHIRNLFDNVGDNYVAQDYRTNPNCSHITMQSLISSETALMGSYSFYQDTMNKVVDTSGNHLHGWAPRGTGRPIEDGIRVREFRRAQPLFLPVPIDYDGREGTISAEMMFQIDKYLDTKMEFVKLRLDTRDTNLYWRFIYDAKKDMAGVEIEWASKTGEDRSFSFYHAFNESLYDDTYHTLTLSWDRRHLGLLTFTLDNAELLRQPIPLVSNNYIGQELWVNAVSDDAADGNLRARIRHLGTYGSALFDHRFAEAYRAVEVGLGGRKSWGSRLVAFVGTCAVVGGLVIVGLGTGGRGRLARRIRAVHIA